MPLEIIISNKKFLINSDRKQILDLLLSVYEASMFQNEELIRTQNLLNETNSDLVRVNEELEAFTRGVTHDLRSPVSTIKMLISLIQNEAINPIVTKHINSIDSVADNMLLLMEDLLRLSKSGMVDLKYTKVDISELSRITVSKLKLTNPERKVEVIVEKDLSLTGDKGLMEVVLENLIGNAWKYTGKTSNAQIHIGKVTNSDVTEFFVSDNGAGFRMDQAQKLFDPFFRLHNSTDFHGTGIGLTTVKRIIDRHNGTIRAEAAPGEGATFYFSIP
jgi:signal transduction histidine kinase